MKEPYPYRVAPPRPLEPSEIKPRAPMSARARGVLYLLGVLVYLYGIAFGIDYGLFLPSTAVKVLSVIATAILAFIALVHGAALAITNKRNL